MKHKILFVFALSGMILGGCAVKKDYVATGGSKSDATVTLSYNYSSMEKPLVNASQAQSLADSRCQVWGYDGAESFGSEFTTCTFRNGYGCSQYRVDTEYQCIGSTD